ncbi:MAG: hypothetical protein B6U78_02920, partial [Candidatus Aenigmarchaeota archaeon ex4484_224]
MSEFYISYILQKYAETITTKEISIEELYETLTEIKKEKIVFIGYNRKEFLNDLNFLINILSESGILRSQNNKIFIQNLERFKEYNESLLRMIKSHEYLIGLEAVKRVDEYFEELGIF